MWKHLLCNHLASLLNFSRFASSSLIPQEAQILHRRILNNLLCPCDLPQIQSDLIVSSSAPPRPQVSSRATPSLPVRIASYNVLAQYQLVNNIHLYTHCDSHILTWKFRRENFHRELETLDADILCLQEVQDNHFHDFFLPCLDRLGYQTFYQKKTRGKCDGVSVSFKTHRFEAVKHLPVSYYSFTRGKYPLLDSDNVGLLVLLRWRGGDDCICIANTHLFFNPNRGDLKLTQLCILLRQADQFTRLLLPEPEEGSTKQRWPLVLCGDFNSEPLSPLLKFLRGGSMVLNERKVCQLATDHNSVVTGATDDMLVDACWGGPPAEFLQRPLSDIHFPEVMSAMMRRMHFLEPPAEELTVETVLRHPFHNFQDVYHPEQLTHQRAEESLGKPAPDVEPTSAISTYTNQGPRAVDYILFSNQDDSQQHVSGAKLCVHSYWGLVSPEQLVSVGGLPNWRHSSDHIPLVTDFCYHTRQNSMSEDISSSTDFANSIS